MNQQKRWTESYIQPEVTISSPQFVLYVRNIIKLILMKHILDWKVNSRVVDALMYKEFDNDVGLVQQYFSYIVAVSFISGGNQSA